MQSKLFVSLDVMPHHALVFLDIIPHHSLEKALKAEQREALDQYMVCLLRITIALVMSLDTRMVLNPRNRNIPNNLRNHVV
jgi:hypothetical protein